MKREFPALACLPVEVAASAFAALGSEQRLTVLRTLVRAGPGGLSMGELGARSGVTGSTLTHHLRILAGAGLASQEKRGRSVIVGAADMTTMQALSDYLLSECCADVPAGQASNGQASNGQAPTGQATNGKVHDHG